MSKQITLPVLLTGLQSKVDGSIKLSLETREIPPESAVELFSLRNQECWVVLAANELKEVSIPDEKADASLGTKTPSQRLRNVLYVLWQQRGKNGDFESFYRIQIEKVIERLKEELEK